MPDDAPVTRTATSLPIDPHRSGTVRSRTEGGSTASYARVPRRMARRHDAAPGTPTRPRPSISGTCCGWGSTPDPTRSRSRSAIDRDDVARARRDQRPVWLATTCALGLQPGDRLASLMPNRILPGGALPRLLQGRTRRHAAELPLRATRDRPRARGQRRGGARGPRRARPTTSPPARSRPSCRTGSSRSKVASVTVRRSSSCVATSPAR